jgi:hypothetical protein
LIAQVRMKDLQRFDLHHYQLIDVALKIQEAFRESVTPIIYLYDNGILPEES